MPVVQVRKTDEKVFKNYKKAVHVNDFLKKLGHKYMELSKKDFLYNTLVASGFGKNDRPFNEYLIGKEIFPKESETIKGLKTLMGNGATIETFTALDTLFANSEAKFIKEIKEKVAGLVIVNNKFSKATSCFNNNFL